jgi:hypothetical protein
MKRLLSLVVTLILMLMLAVGAFGQITAVPNSMNFQGRLAKPDGTPVANGNYSIRFSLWSAATAGTERWSQTVNPVAVRNGTFAVLLSNFPPTAFDGDNWLEIKIGTNTPLTPRQQLVSVAYAMKAGKVPDGSIGTTQIANNAITSAKIADGTITNADLVSGTLNPLAWLLGGNSGTNPASQFLGTTDNQALAFRTNNVERMRLLANGSLGIGTNAPTQALDVVGNIRSRGGDFILDGRGGGVGNGVARALVDGGVNDPFLFPRYGLILNFDNDFGLVWVDSDLAVNNNLLVGKGFTAIPQGLSWEVGGFSPLLNLDVNFRLPDTNTDFPGGAVRIDSRTDSPLFQFWGRNAGSNVENLLFRIDANGNVGIGNVVPVFKFEVDGGARLKSNLTVDGTTDSRVVLSNSAGASLLTFVDANRAWLRTTNSAHPLWLGTNNGATVAIQGGTVGINTTTPSTLFALDIIGQVRASGGYITSDARYKQGITPLADSLDALLRLQGVGYEWKRNAFPEHHFPTGRQIGFIAQEVENIFPELVSTDEKGYKSVNYVAVVPVLVEAIKTLNAKLDDRQKQSDALQAVQAENAALKQRSAALEATLTEALKRLERLEKASPR